MAMWTSWLPAFHGQGSTDVVARNGCARLLRCRIGVGEVVHHLLDAHGIAGRHAAGAEVAAHECIRAVSTSMLKVDTGCSATLSVSVGPLSGNRSIPG
jgi:hypothetical protein